MIRSLNVPAAEVNLIGWLRFPSGESHPICEEDADALLTFIPLPFQFDCFIILIFFFSHINIFWGPITIQKRSKRVGDFPKNHERKPHFPCKIEKMTKKSALKFSSSFANSVASTLRPKLSLLFAHAIKLSLSSKQIPSQTNTQSYAKTGLHFPLKLKSIRCAFYDNEASTFKNDYLTNMKTFFFFFSSLII